MPYGHYRVITPAGYTVKSFLPFLDLTSAINLPISTGVSGLGTGVATFLATPSSANLAAAVTNETGSGALVFATSPTLVTPALGTPASGNLSNCTGLNECITLSIAATLSLLDSTNYYYGIHNAWITATPNLASLKMSRAGTITRVEFMAAFAAAGSNESVNHYVRFNDTTDNCNATSTYDSANLTAVAVWTGSQAVAANDNICVKVATPAWATNPTNIKGNCRITFIPT